MREQEELEQELQILNVSLGFLLLIILAVLLSLWSALLQRCQLKQAMEGRVPIQVQPVDYIRRIGSAITVGCLGYFLCLALEIQKSAQTRATRRSAQVNTAASLFVLLAAILRLVDLQTVERERQTPLLEETTLPD